MFAATAYNIARFINYNLHCAFYTLNSRQKQKLYTPHSTVVDCTLYTPYFPLDTPHTLHFTFYTLHSARYTFYIPHSSCTSMIFSCQFHILTCCFSLVGPRLSRHHCWAPVCSAVLFCHLVIVYSNCITNGTSVFSHYGATLPRNFQKQMFAAFRERCHRATNALLNLLHVHKRFFRSWGTRSPNQTAARRGFIFHSLQFLKTLSKMYGAFVFSRSGLPLLYLKQSSGNTYHCLPSKLEKNLVLQK